MTRKLSRAVIAVAFMGAAGLALPAISVPGAIPGGAPQSAMASGMRASGAVAWADEDDAKPGVTRKASAGTSEPSTGKANAKADGKSGASKDSAHRTGADTKSAGKDEDDAKPSPPLSIEITSVGEPVLKRNATLKVSVSIANATGSEVTLESVKLSMRGYELSTRGEVVSFLAGELDSGEVLAEAGRNQKIGPNSTVHVDLTVPASTLTWDADTWGPRGIEVTTSAGENSAADRSLAILAPEDGISRASTGVVLPLTASTQELSSREPDFATLTAEGEAVPERIRKLGTLMGPGVTAIADPAYAEAAKGAAQVVLTPGRDADIAALVHAGDDDTARKLLGTDEPAALLAAPGIDMPVLEAVAAASDTAVIVSGDDIPANGSLYTTPRTRTRLEIGDGLDVLVVDSASSSALAGSLPERSMHSASSEASTLSPLDSRQLTLALSAATYREQPDYPRPQLLALDRADVRQYGSDAPGSGAIAQLEASHLNETIDALMSAPWVQPTTVGALAATDSSTVWRTIPAEGNSQGEIPASQTHAVVGGLRTATRVSTLLDEPALLTTPCTELADGALSVAWRSDPIGREAYIHHLSGFFSEIGGAIAPASTSTINVIAEDTELPVRVQNQLPFAAKATVELDSVSARLSPKSSVTAQLPPASTTTVNIPVTARGSGDVDARVQLRDGAGMRFGERGRIDVRVRAMWENWATFALGGLAFVALMAGVAISFKKGRRSKPITAQEYSEARHFEDRKRKGESLYPQLHFPPVGREGANN